MRFGEIWRRAELNSIETFLKYGGEDLGPWVKETYAQRLKTADKNILDFLKENTDLTDECMGFLYEQISIYEDVYFEIGLLLGGKLAFCIGEKIKELG
ncbi:MAG: hypothetical protein II359_05235 [Clostridia bacterium]|nr:hypothetical protein [Clostridia bacterium]